MIIRAQRLAAPPRTTTRTTRTTSHYFAFLNSSYHPTSHRLSSAHRLKHEVSTDTDRSTTDDEEGTANAEKKSINAYRHANNEASFLRRSKRAKFRGLDSLASDKAR